MPEPHSVQVIRDCIEDYAKSGGPGDPFYDAMVALESLEEQVQSLELACDHHKMFWQKAEERERGLKEQYAALEAHDEKLSELNTEMATRLDELEEQVETLRQLNDRVIGERDSYERVIQSLDEQMKEHNSLLEQLGAYQDAVERLRLKVLDRPADTEERDTYADGFTSGLREALQMTRVDIAASFPASEPDA